MPIPGRTRRGGILELLADGVDMIREIPDDRYDIDDFYDPDPDAAGKIYTRYGGFLDGIDGFDPEFFGISPREAVWIDPAAAAGARNRVGGPRAGRVRACRRCAAAEVACTWASAPTSIRMCCPAAAFEDIEAQFATGNATSVIAGRVAFALGLEGPAVSLDTACSSSLVAIHHGVPGVAHR